MATAIGSTVKTKQARGNAEWLSDLSAGGQDQAAALEELREILIRSVRYYLSGKLPNHDWIQLSEDMTQEALLKILAKAHTFEGKSKFTTWAIKIAINTTAAHLRRMQWKEVPLEVASDDGEEFSLLDRIASEAQEREPELAVQRQEALETLRSIIATELTERQRTAMVNVLIHNVPLDVIADRLMTNRNNLYKVTHDARLKLKRKMAEAGFTPEQFLSLFGPSG